MDLKSRIGIVAPAAALIMSAGAAWAQPAPGGRSGYDRPMNGQPARSPRAQAARPRQKPQYRSGEQVEENEGRAQSITNITRTDDSGTYTVKIEGDEVTATVNGREVPADRIQRDASGVRLLDEDGKVVADFQIGQGPATGTWAETGAWRFPPPAPGQDFYGNAPRTAVAGDNPPVMLGITMGEPSDTLLDQLGLEKGSAVLIDKVYDGLPAAKAGLKDSDILVELDGNKPLDEAKVREILKSKTPGDEVEAKVVRKGATKTLKIKLVAFDPEKLGAQAGGQDNMLFTTPDLQGMDMRGMMGIDMTGEARKALENALKSLEKSQGQDANAVRDQARQAIEEALKSLKEGAGAYKFSPRALTVPGRRNVILGPNPGQVYNVPQPPTPPSAPGAPRDGDLSRQMDDLRSQLDEVQRSRDELKAQLDEIKSMLKEMKDSRDSRGGR